MLEETIDSFSGENRFLSNFWPTRIFYEGVIFPTVEHAYVAAKGGIDVPEYLMSLCAMTAGQAKKQGRIVAMRKGWDSLKDCFMLDFTRQKYSHEPLAKLLLLTGDKILIEGNTWGDRYWGQSPVGVGENRLGKIIMKVRKELRKTINS